MKNFHRGIVLALLAAFISGFSIWINAFGVDEFTPALFTGLKNLAVGLMLVGILIGARELPKLMQLSRNAWLQLTVIALTGGSTAFILFFNGLAQTTAARGGFIQKLLFIIVAYFAARMLNEQITRFMWLGLAALAVGQALFLQFIPTSFSHGDMLILFAALLWAFETVLSKQLMADVSPTIVIAGRMFLGSIFIWAYLYMTGTAAEIASLQSLQYGWIAFTALLLLAYVLTFYHSLQLLPAHVATAVLALAAPLTAALSALFQSRSMTVLELSGIILMAAALLLVIRGAYRGLTNGNHTLHKHHPRHSA